MARRRKREQNMGRVVIALGLCFKLIQIIGASLGADFFGGTVMTVITACLLAGGLCVYAFERMSIVSAFAMVSLVGVFGGLIPTNEAVYSFLFMAIWLVGHGAMLAFSKRGKRIVCAAAVLILTVALALQYLSVLSFSGPVITLMLAATYIFMAMGLFL